jgi:hypothetical protein
MTFSLPLDSKGKSEHFGEQLECKSFKLHALELTVGLKQQVVQVDI